MKRLSLCFAGLWFLSCGAAFAQPPERPGREGGRSDRPEGRAPRDAGPRDAGPPPNPIMDALDPNHDHVLSADEIKSAVTALLKLDKNGDGELTEQEFRPERAGPNNRPPRDGDARPRGEGPPRDGDARPRGEGPPPRRDGFGPPEGRGPGGPGPGGFGGPGGGPPSPERFVQHLMEFDADKDGLLSKQEIMKFAEQMGRGPGGPGGRGPGGRGPGGERGRPGDRPGGPGDQPRPKRPTRPQIDQ